MLVNSNACVSRSIKQEKEKKKSKHNNNNKSDKIARTLNWDRIE